MGACLVPIPVLWGPAWSLPLCKHVLVGLLCGLTSPFIFLAHILCCWLCGVDLGFRGLLACGADGWGGLLLVGLRGPEGFRVQA